MELSEKDIQRFWSKVDRRGPDDCWEWLGGRDGFGYGRFCFKGKETLAHRAAWQLEKGPIPAGMCVCHSCDNPPCANPAHLFLGTQSENHADMVRKGRIARGEKNGMTKITAAQVTELCERYAAGETQTALAAEFGVTQPAVSYAILHRGKERGQ